MLREKHIVIAALACALLGLATLLFLNTVIGPAHVDLHDIDEKLIGETITTKGRVTWSLEKDNFVLFTLEEGKKIKAVKFSPTRLERAVLKPGTYVKVSGKVELYKNEIEIVAGAVTRWTGN